MSVKRPGPPGRSTIFGRASCYMSKLTGFCAVAVLNLAGAVSLAEEGIYKFVDENGVMHFTNVPDADSRYKPSARTVLPGPSTSSASATAPIPPRGDTSLEGSNVVESATPAAGSADSDRPAEPQISPSDR
jgi:hypothetical protein